MRKISTCVMMFVAVAMLAVACEKAEEPIVPEAKLVGAWTAPLSSTDEIMHDLGGKNLVINPNHTASFSYLSFKNWKIEGEVLTMTNYTGEGVNRHVEVLRYIINNYTDTSMLLTGRYIYAVGDSVYREGDFSGLYKRDKSYPVQ